MSEGRGSVLAATAAVFLQGRRVGSAVVVDDRHLLTARHVLLRRDPESGAKSPVQQVELEFPAAAPAGAGRMTASRVALGSASDGVDVAVLELADPVVKNTLPAPVTLWPAARLPRRVEVFGYPLAEGALNGVWREFSIAGPTAAGAVQLDWTGECRDLSRAQRCPGGGCGDRGVGRGTGRRSPESGRFDRFLPITLIARLWPGLPRPWLMAGVDGRSHFTRRARGQRSRARGGDLFRGRQAALAVVRGWLTAPDSPGVPLVITGQPGAGKSAVLARAVLGLQDERVGPGLAVHGRGATHAELLTAVAALTGVERVESQDALLDILAEATPAGPWRIAWDALDEAATAADRQQIAETLTELAALPGIRVAVATRPMAGSDRQRYLPGGLLAGLGVSAADSPNLVDLDTDRYFDPAGLEQFTAALLAQDGFDRPGPTGRAWTHYRTHSHIRDRLARVIAGRAGRNYLVAAMAAVPLSVSPAPVDPGAEGFDERTIPAGIGEALQKYLEAPGVDETWTRGLLTALAYARGAGIPDPLWLGFAAALGYPATVLDLDRLRASTAADYLLQTQPAAGGAVTRLFHQALIDELLTPRPDPRSDEQRLFDVLREQVSAAGGWAQAGDYPRRHAADHAAAAGELPRLLADPHYLAVADFPHLLPLLAGGVGPAGGRPDGHGFASGRGPRRGVAARSPGAVARAHRRPPRALRHPPPVGRGLHRWARAPVGAQPGCATPRTHRPHRPGDGGGGGPGRWSGGDRLRRLRRTVRVWDAGTGQPVGAPLTGHTGAVEAVAVGRVGDREVIVSGGSDETVRIWDAGTGQPVGHPLTGHTGTVVAVAVGRVGGREVIVSGRGRDGAGLGCGYRATRRAPADRPHRHGGGGGGGPGRWSGGDRLRQLRRDGAGLGCGYRATRRAPVDRPHRRGGGGGGGPGRWSGGDRLRQLRRDGAGLGCGHRAARRAPADRPHRRGGGGGGGPGR